MKYKLILASNSPRRKELLTGLGLNFDVRVFENVCEDYPDTLSITEIPVYIAKKKASPYEGRMAADELIITADTIVTLNGNVLGKPKDEQDAFHMLKRLSGKTHQVITGVCLKTIDRQRTFSVTTDVTFKALSDEEIHYYITHYQPLDKAGAYGIQEWIGYVGVTGISGSYFNVVGLPVQRIYQELLKMKEEKSEE